ncbi:MAG: peptidylprolyl isomerase [Bradymonadaceae bacterium]|nr:peptidylprolyl isomerase [Lujinxingiaceae bacterium]
MANDQLVAQDKVVLIHYTLKNGDGEVLDSSLDTDPMPYLHGAGNIVPGLERQLEGKSVGDKFIAEVPPEEGYGLAEGPGPQALPRNTFPPNVDIEEGMAFMAQGPSGQPIPLWVTAIDDEQVYVDTNHPLAGETLFFDVEIVRIREANSDELNHGHPHGLDGTEGHHH